ncbi:tetratricopeptide repeat protein [Saccharospirillum mangrovi]|uniref:O-linked N-acetylglucosamine transferase, SPINDLY family protein n=1 Tax=Saccharospirillum mangrovi TaxID=2161747 RepID=UPI000D337721|nr:tetratricopeptide repeat protein [Saccharospirillum mangrovi]
MSFSETFESAKRALAAGKTERAESLFRGLVDAEPNQPEYRLQLALSLVHLNRLEDALAQLDWLASQYGPVPPVAVNRGEILRRLGRYDEAVQTLSALVRQQPTLTAARFNLALSLRGAGQLDAAINEYRQALLQQPGNGDGWYNLGNALLENGQVSAAIESYHHALDFVAGATRAKVLNNLGSAFILQREPGEAIQPLQQALQQQADYSDAQLNLSRALERTGAMLEAERGYRQLAKLNPDHWWHELHADNLCPDVYESSDAIDQWRDRFQQKIAQWSQRSQPLPLDTLHLSGAEPTYKLMYQGREDRRLKVIYAQMLADRLPKFDAPEKRRGADKLRIGMVVSRGHEGIFARSLKGMMPHFDRHQFEIVVAVNRPALAATQALLPSEHVHWLPLSMRVDEAADQLRKAQLDVLYHWEVGTDTFNYFLPWFRCAPVQYTSWAWPMTTGIPTMDFFLTSDLVEPENAQRLYSEPLLSMKSNMFTWAEPPQVKTQSVSRAEFGFGEREHLYICHQNPRKVHPDFDALVASILQRDPDGRLLLIGGAEANEATLLQQRLQRSLGAMISRVTILPRMPNDKYLDLLRCVDVALDPPHYTGANTSYDALGLGLPVVTQRSVLLRGNFTSGLYRQLGDTTLVADSAEQYVDLAVGLAQDAEQRNHWQRWLLDGRDRIFYDSQSVSELEDAWLKMAGI